MFTRKDADISNTRPLVATFLSIVLITVLWHCGTLRAQQVVEQEITALGHSGSAAINDDANFLIAWTTWPGDRHDIRVLRFQADGQPLGNGEDLSDTGSGRDNYEPSLAMSRDGYVQAAWIQTETHFRDKLLTLDFTFDDFDFTPPAYDPLGGGADERPSVGVSNNGDLLLTWHRMDSYLSQAGLLAGPAPSLSLVIRDCDPSAPCAPACTYCRVTNEPEAGLWNPCISVRSDARYAVVWADAEEPTAQYSSFNIALRIYDSNASDVLAQLEGQGPDPDEKWVNQPALEGLGSNQISPAVAFDDAGNVVVAWIGWRPTGCAPAFRVFARRFKFEFDSQAQEWVLRDPDPDLGEGWPGMFIVDNDPNASPLVSPDDPLAHPTVALSLDQVDPGRFIVAWNAGRIVVPVVYHEIRGQYFDSRGAPRGREFRVNQDNSVTDPGTESFAVRRIARSAQHPLVYGPDDQVVATWTPDLDQEGVWFTLLPPDHAESTCATASCTKGDTNGDGNTDGLDIQNLVDALLGTYRDPGVCEFEIIFDICPFDINEDCLVNMDDVPLFVGILLGQSMGRLLDDCNNNGVPDANDIAGGTSEDCNKNFIPDECDVDPADPDGDGEVSNDLNINSIPDECEANCNKNAIPDDKDISDGTSADVNGNSVPDECEADCNSNSVPDEWDISQGTSADCNANGLPDECEYDCNDNGVPDACDIDPSDPDGDGEVFEDCQGSGLPDECDFTLPLMPSADCNENGVPDECDIASGTSEDCNDNGFPDECDIARPRRPSPDCNANGIPDECDLADCPPEDPGCQDCNVNGVPDECDIAGGTSLDANTNGIPDECEGGGEGGGGQGGGGMMRAGELTLPGGEAEPDPDIEAAWAEFFAWFILQDWGPEADTSGAEQHQMMVDQLEELGLPIADPWQ